MKNILKALVAVLLCTLFIFYITNFISHRTGENGDFLEFQSKYDGIFLRIMSMSVEKGTEKFLENLQKPEVKADIKKLDDCVYSAHTQFTGENKETYLVMKKRADQLTYMQGDGYTKWSTMTPDEQSDIIIDYVGLKTAYDIKRNNN